MRRPDILLCLLPLLLVVLWPVAPQVHAAEWTVPDNPGCGTIQGCIEQAVDGDVITVLPGTYEERIDFLGKAITVRSQGGAEVTIIDAGRTGTVVTFQSGEGDDSLLEGFTIQGGRSELGAGVYVLDSSPRISSCTVTGNSAYGYGSGGGGIGIEDGAPLISGCRVAENGSYADGGSQGGGILIVDGSPVIRSCTIVGNSAGIRDIRPHTGGVGGGLCVLGGIVTVSGSVIRENFAGGRYLGWGGGIAVLGGSGLIENSIIADNQVGSWWNGACGGGLATGWLGSTCPPSVTVLNCTFSGNEAEGGEVWAGGAVAAMGGITSLVNTILWADEVAPTGEGPELAVGVFAEPAILEVSYSDVAGGQADVVMGEAATLVWGEGNIDRDPDLTGDYRLGPRSFCIDAGTDAGVAEDIDGDPRPQGGGFDMGADEFTGEPEVALLSPDMWEVLETAPSFLWSPGGCEAYLFLGYVPYTWQGGVVYRPASFWMTDPGLTMPPEWWDAVAPASAFVWAVIGYDEDDGLYRWSSTAPFTKAATPPASTVPILTRPGTRAAASP